MEIEKGGGGGMTNLFLLVLVADKDGWFKEIWSASNCHNFLDGNRSFSIGRKGGMLHVFEKLSTKTFPKHIVTEQ
jgi:hypothetical protein